MKNILTILKFELSNYFQNKSYIISTAVIAILIAVIMFLPNFIDLGLSDNSSDSATTEESAEETDNDGTEESIEEQTYLYYDKSQLFCDADTLNQAFEGQGVTWKSAVSIDEIKKAVEDEKADAGFVINSLTDYDYYVYNKGMYDYGDSLFEQLLTTTYQQNYCQEHNLNYEEVQPLLNVSISCNEQVLGKDMGDSYWYCYFLVILVFMLIVIYGVMIATSVTTEKSNRSIEVLVTSTKSTSLLFGKVLAGTIASFLQIGIILLVALGGYKLNMDAWGHSLDMVLNIDPTVLITFAFFGITGFVFYAFVYGAVGALVSKTEDINKSASSVQMVIMLVYFVVLFQMSNIDGIIMKIASFLPISSYSAMFIRVAMGEVQIWEVIVSYLILLVSTIGVGLLGAKIYRLGTLRYGNPIKITTALKSLKNHEE